MRVSHVAVVGAGLIGRAWAIVFARAGLDVRLTDPDAAALDRARPAMAADCHDLADAGLIGDAQACLDRIATTDDLAQAVAGATFVQENGPERLDVKRELFARLDALAPPDAILASSTSAIVASAFTQDLPGRARCLVAHPVNPPHLVPLVELCGAPWTDLEVIARARAFYERAGQVPIEIRREREGFVLNRLQGALLAEAFRLVGEGTVSPRDLDHCLKDGLALRWSFMGPFETIELNAPGGIPDYCERYTGFYRRLAQEPPAPDVYGADNVARILDQWNEAPTPQRLASRTIWRNRRLAALVAHKRGQPEEP
jgi:3-hydroxyacyl-CoA dehydrogenase